MRSISLSYFIIYRAYYIGMTQSIIHNGNYHDNNTQLRLSNSTLQCNLHAEMRWGKVTQKPSDDNFPFKCLQMCF